MSAGVIHIAKVTAGLLMLCALAAPMARAEEPTTANNPPPLAAPLYRCEQAPEHWRPTPADLLPPRPEYVTGEFRCLNKYVHETGMSERVCEWTDG